MAWMMDPERPIYSQIVERLEMQIVSGIYQPGAKLPSVRELAAEASVNPNTMQKAFSELERSGLIVTQRTSGRTVTEEVELIMKIKNELAQQQLSLFFAKMRELGFSKDEIVALINNNMMEEK